MKRDLTFLGLICFPYSTSRLPRLLIKVCPVWLHSVWCPHCTGTDTGWKSHYKTAQILTQLIEIKNICFPPALSGKLPKKSDFNPLKNFQNLLKNLKSCGEYLNAYDGSAPRFLKYVVWKIPLKRFVCVNICTSKHSRNIICWSLIVTFWEVLKPICKLHSSRLPLGDCAKLAEKELCTFPAFLRQQIKRKSLLLLGAQSAPPWFYRWD